MTTVEVVNIDIDIWGVNIDYDINNINHCQIKAKNAGIYTCIMLYVQLW